MTPLLYAKDASGCPSTVLGPMKVSNIVKQVCAFKAAFTTPKVIYEPKEPITFTNTSTGGTQFKWLLDKKEVSQSRNYAPTGLESGVYGVRLVATDGTCADTSAFTVFHVFGCGGSLWFNGDFETTNDAAASGVRSECLIDNFDFIENML